MVITYQSLFVKPNLLPWQSYVIRGEEGQIYWNVVSLFLGGKCPDCTKSSPNFHNQPKTPLNKQVNKKYPRKLPILPTLTPEMPLLLILCLS